MGRPSKYQEDFAKQALKLCRLGATDRELADFFGVNEDTINEWKKVHPEFSESLKEGKGLADAEVADKLFRRATGYEHEAVKIVANANTGQEHIVHYTERYPPDTTAAIFWLKNRRPDLWRDQKVIESTITHKTELTDADLEAIATGSGTGASGKAGGSQVTH